MDSAGCVPLDVGHGFVAASTAGAGSANDVLARPGRGPVADAPLRDRLARFRGRLLADLPAAYYAPLILQLPLPCAWYQG